MKTRLLAVLLLLMATGQTRALTPGEAVTAALKDADNQNSTDQPFLRYLYLPETDEETLGKFLTALRLHVNLISREAAFAYPRKVAAGLWAVDLRDYQWRKQTFENLAKIDPYFHRQVVEVVVEVVEVEVEVVVDQPYGYYVGSQFYQTRIVREKVKKIEKREEKKRVVKSTLFVPLGAAQLAGLALLTQSEVPIVRADWFLVQGARQISLTNRVTGTGYYDWLGGLKNSQDYFRLIGFDPEAAARSQSEIRAVIGESGVAAQNRQVIRNGATTGALWTTLETFDQSGAGVAINHLRRGEFRSDASEFYGVLPNGLPATFLADAKGVAQESVPDKIAGNRAALNVSNDLRVHVNIACIQCHYDNILHPLPDDVRAVYTGRLQLFSADKNVSLELRRQYSVSLDRSLERDRSSYREAFLVVGGQPVKDVRTIVENYSNAFTGYAYGRVTLGRAARELGTTPEKFVGALKQANERLGHSDFRLDPFLVPGRTLPVQNWEDVYSTAQDVLFGVLDQKGQP